jgi:hypothetical protein
MRERHGVIGQIFTAGAKTRSIAGAMAIALVAGGCTADTATPEPATPTPVATSTTTGATEIPQPPIPVDLPLAATDARVDVAMPSFSDPTTITNPLFPVSDQASVLLLGHVEGEPFRTEVTLLPETRIVQWEGQQVETVVSQYVAFRGGSIEEVAYDLYAQADDGSVWYFGEDVFDFREGAIVVTEGTWLAGRDGPAAMIMPADPQVGDVYRPENAPGFVFEEVTVRSTSESLLGPLGPVEGGMIASELHMDGGRERKVFAPGYGEFSTAADGDVEALAMAVPTDAAGGDMPEELVTLANRALETYEAAGRRAWNNATANVEAMVAAWRSLPTEGVPRLVGPVLARALRELERSVETEDPTQARNDAIAVARSTFDLQLRYRPVEEVDLARMDLWAAQLINDEAAGDALAVAADAFALDYTRDRILEALDPETLARVNTVLGTIQVAVVDEEPAAAAEAAAELRRILADFRA